MAGIIQKIASDARTDAIDALGRAIAEEENRIDQQRTNNFTLAMIGDEQSQQSGKARLNHFEHRRKRLAGMIEELTSAMQEDYNAIVRSDVP